ncbi:MAG TPA: DUF4331 family protein [Gemmatimonadota bacterium]|nr:DUF4331 family protein [Gemmatimonadota bacterium]
MSNHFTGLRLGPPAEDPRLDLTDLFAFQAPADPTRTVLILNANTFGVADAFHPDAVYRINIDNDGDAETDVAFSVVFDKPEDGRQRATVYMATGRDARRSEAVGSPIVTNAEVSFGPEPRIVTAGARTFFAGSRSDPFFVDFAGILAAFNWKDGKNFTDLKDVDPFPWTGNDTLAVYNAFGIVLELPTSELGPDPSLGIWGRASVHRNGTFDHVDRAGHPTIASFFNTDETKEQYNRTEPARDRELFLHQAIEILEHNGGYSAQQAEAVIDEAGLLPDMLRYDPARPAKYPNGRTLSDHVVEARLAMISNNSVPSDGLRPHDDLLEDFPYLGTPHPSPPPPPPPPE